MDGTLLTPEGEVPGEFWALQERMHERGIEFVPASGRQLATLRATFGGEADGTAGESGAPGIDTYVAENGTLVVHDGEVVATTTVDAPTAHRVVARVRELVAGGLDLGLVVCGVETAYVERADEAFLAEARKYYHRLQIVPDLDAVEGDVLKLAVHDFADAEATSSRFADLAETHQVVVSGAHWIDVMHPEADKGRGIRALQDALGITPAQTAVFGDYLNDLAMYDVAEWSFAMANAHPRIMAAARYTAPSNAEHGVVRVLERLLG
ncbi:Cof-type HAD-IIB family hydrolase [Brachybacterium halotolerans subsp. kimchii]|nr:Cof-type HAD-IIB family hydrolase [Brachybacterium halotolerans subsp. kimchii]